VPNGCLKSEFWALLARKRSAPARWLLGFGEMTREQDPARNGTQRGNGTVGITTQIKEFHGEKIELSPKTHPQDPPERASQPND
jgi:hypothetical protein